MILYTNGPDERNSPTSALCCRSPGGHGRGCLFQLPYCPGGRGLIAWVHLKNEIVKAEEILAEIRARKESLESRVSLLRPESLDPDMLEERARIMLNMGRPDERVIPLDHF